MSVSQKPYRGVDIGPLWCTVSDSCCIVVIVSILLTLELVQRCVDTVSCLRALMVYSPTWPDSALSRALGTMDRHRLFVAVTQTRRRTGGLVHLMCVCSRDRREDGCALLGRSGHVRRLARISCVRPAGVMLTMVCALLRPQQCQPAAVPGVNDSCNTPPRKFLNRMAGMRRGLHSRSRQLHVAQGTFVD